ncbi:putative phosphoenolpyruvate synthase [Folsomia candida]|uniref:Putative phosphoenolpyruvate synthase n=1 Tax=Folsomia candida TaxID=158441 RepID=A0A226F1M0_FOLCA|nr:putative phosphoenolpyruvate synthase [Folsomia candida]
MILHILRFVLTTLTAGLVALNRITCDIFPKKLRRILNKVALSNWVVGLPQIIPVYNTSTPKSAKEAGILAHDVEWDLETPHKLESIQDADDLLIHGVDDKGNCLVGRITRYHNNMTKVSVALRRSGQTFTVELEGETPNQVEFSLGNFKLELLEPFRSWRLWFNGYMRDMIPNGYHQFGILHGVANVDGDNNSRDNALYMYGTRTRRRLTLNHSNDALVEIFAMQDKDGDVLRLMSRNGVWIDGEESYSSTLVVPTEQIHVDATGFDKNSTIPKLFEVADKKSTMRVEIWPNYDSVNVNDSLDFVLLQMEINGKEAHGIIIRISNPPLLITSAIENRKPVDVTDVLAISLELDICRNTGLVGGKGASLAKLAAMNRRTIKEFKTARGFCATTNLFCKIVDEKRLKKIFEDQATSLEESCLGATEFVMSCTSAAAEDIRPLVESHLGQIFGESRSHELRFAVRSSGILEDGSDLSCAGQNASFLDLEETAIPQKIVQCWASAFTFQSVSYRLNHGQPAVTRMGVVIQEMVDASAAGVLFTADPLTGNPFQILITANYGLGESVVNATCDPDCITIQRPRSIQCRGACQKTQLSIHQKIIGQKKSKVILKSGRKSTEEETLSDFDSTRLCLSEPDILQLAVIGINVEKELGQLKPVDIEWAITQTGDIYVLQSRPMTSLDAWTDFEIMHQFDSSIRTRIELLTRANAGEVMPKPLHACTIQSLTRNLDIGLQNGMAKRSKDTACSVVSKSCHVHCNKLFVSVYPTLYRTVDAKITAAICCLDLTVFGRPMITPEVHKVAVERYGASSPSSKIFGAIGAIKSIRNNSKKMDQIDAAYGAWTSKLNNKDATISAKTIYDQITADLMVVHHISVDHCVMSGASSTTLIFAFMAISEGKQAQDWSPSLYEDVGRLLSVYAAVESAEIPTDMDKLADAILLRGETDTFIATKTSKDAISWLQSDPFLAKELETFFIKHGHRSIAEMNIGQDTWRTDPTPYVTLLKNVLVNKVKNPARPTVNQTDPQNDQDLLSSLSTPLENGTKRFLKFLLPYCRQTVTYRERTKSIMVKVLEQIKYEYKLLAEAMLKERTIPDTNLIKHLTHHEMGLLISKHHSSSAIINRAIKRMRLYPVMEGLDFPEISVGIPKPLSNSTHVETCDVVKGTPVSAGKIRGTAKVCLNVEDASSQLEDGDILITTGTDIAWSPFFPMLGGVVTELGGLISHGAVVAREYGLPCIVGAVNATKIFRSGDEIVLDTSAGTISKIKI